MSVVCAFPRARLHLHRLTLRVVRAPRQVGLYWYNALTLESRRTDPVPLTTDAARWMEKMCQGDTSFPNSRIAPYTARVTSSNAFTTSRMPARASRAVGSKCAPTRSSTFALSDAESRHVSAGTCSAGYITTEEGNCARMSAVRGEHSVM
ncbi:hypothetical protein DFH08DRAFT_235556 [Mycena albidolilacea]|uniref:Uncharacterized protein n=1 Tax=Mycena albidolilacea TaxID=1033008 RepID=A0AAD6ZW33_9AGAR|nr:hypothetical protein DFH08DRAFT_235556 [Mycena albidolilacea]